jgi:hypothetical protein
MSEIPKVLAACPPFAFPVLEKALGSCVDLLAANSLDKALEALRGDARPEAIVCGVHFDDSRMFDLPTLAETIGPEEAEQEFRSVVLALLPRRRAEPGSS